MDVNEILKDLDQVPKDIRTAVRNNGGGFANHNFFWEILGPGEQTPEGEIAQAINDTFGSLEEFKKQFSHAAVTLFGSGWAWLVVSDGKLGIMQTTDQGNPLSVGKTPLLCVDVWEHAYYLKYQNKRADFVEAFFNVINWKRVNELFLEARGQ